MLTRLSPCSPPLQRWQEAKPSPKPLSKAFAEPRPTRHGTGEQPPRRPTGPTQVCVCATFSLRIRVETVVNLKLFKQGFHTLKTFGRPVGFLMWKKSQKNGKKGNISVEIILPFSIFCVLTRTLSETPSASSWSRWAEGQIRWLMGNVFWMGIFWDFPECREVLKVPLVTYTLC